MRTGAQRIFLALIVVLTFSFVGIAQDRDAISAAAGDLYVVSAKPGGVNFVQGNVTINRADGTSGSLIKGDRVEVGDVVETGRNGRAEILLNPGSFARLDYDSRFSFSTTKLSNLKVNVGAGSVIFEVYASNDFKVKVDSGDSTFYLVKSGVYRVDMISSDAARLEVWNGKAQVGDLNATKVKKGRAALTTSSDVSVSKFRKDMDEFENWSKSRAKLVAKATGRLANQRASRSAMSSFRNYSWNCYDTLGLWMYEPQIRSYTFLPFGYGWRSPYGYRLGAYNDTCMYPESFWRRPVFYPRGGGSSPGTTNTPGTPNTPVQANIDRGTKNTTPPFERMQQTKSVRRVGPRSSFPNSSTGPNRTNRSTRTNTTRTTKTSVPVRPRERTTKIPVN